MGRRLADNKKRIVQRSIGFTFEQFEFFNEHPDFKPDVYCREAVNNQIRMIDPNFLKNEKTTE